MAYIGSLDSHDEHHPARDHDGQKCDDVHSAENIQSDEAWTSQLTLSLFGFERHVEHGEENWG
jgi:hypothetical protein